MFKSFQPGNRIKWKSAKHLYHVRCRRQWQRQRQPCVMCFDGPVGLMVHPINEVRYFFVVVVVVVVVACCFSGNHSGIELKARIPDHLHTHIHPHTHTHANHYGQPHNECRLHFKNQKISAVTIAIAIVIVKKSWMWSLKFCLANANGSISRLATIWPGPISYINTFSRIFHPSIPTSSRSHTRVNSTHTSAHIKTIHIKMRSIPFRQ